MNLQRTLLAGITAGGLAGLLLGILVVSTVAPLIHRAEVYETSVEDNHTHGQEEPWKETLLTFCGTTTLGVAFGVLTSLLLRVLPQQGFRTKWVFGLLFGFCGFLAVYGIPALGLPPPPPGVIGAEWDLSGRQAWWVLTVGTSIMAFLVLAFVPSLLRSRFPMKRPVPWVVVPGAALSLFLLPFLLGVPEHSTASVVPEWLRLRFLFASLATNALFWLALGTLSTLFLRYADGEDEGAKNA